MSLTASSNWGAPQSLPPPAIGRMRVRQRLGVFVAASLFLHALTFGSYAPGSAGNTRDGGSPLQTVLQTRLVHEPIQQQAGPTARVTSTEGALPGADRKPTQAEAPPEFVTASGRGAVPMPMPERWYEAADLDTRAQPLSPVELAYPAELAGMSAAPAKVRLRLFIDERGALRRLEVETSGPRPEFDEAAIRAWEAVRFSPAMKDGATVKSQKLLEVAFAP